MNEAQAIQMCVKDKAPMGFEFLVEQYKREAYYHALSFTNNKEDAADACQDAFRKAFAAMPRLQSLDHFYPWFYRILKNHCINMAARKRTAKNNQRETHDGKHPGNESVTPSEEPEDVVLRDIWKSPYSKFAKGAAIWMIIGGYAALGLVGLYGLFFSDSKGWQVKIPIAAVVIGVLTYLALKIRERVATHKVDPYKEVER